MTSQGASPPPMEGEESPEEEREVTFVAEKDEVDALVASIAELERNAAPLAFKKLTQIVLRYQELPQFFEKATIVVDGAAQQIARMIPGAAEKVEVTPEIAKRIERVKATCDAEIIR